MAALVAVMIMVSIGTFSWASVFNVKHIPKTSTMVMITTVSVVVFSHNLALGVFCGVLLSAMFFARKVSRYLDVTSTLSKNKKHRTYTIEGQMFFASTERTLEGFIFKENIDKVTIDLTKAHFWDLSAVSTLDRIIQKFHQEKTKVKITGINKASQTIVDRYAEFNSNDKMIEIA